MTANPLDPAAHFARLAELLELEAEAEARQVVERVQRLPTAQAEASGYSLVDLVFRDGYPGLGGRYLLTLSKRDLQARLPWTRLGSGTPVVLSLQGTRRAEGYRGVVSDRGTNQVQVAFNEPPDDEGPGALWRLDIAPDEAARIRQRQALDRAAGARRNRLAELRSVLLGERSAEFAASQPFDILDENLNDSQREAVAFALTARDVALLHGPPGTGKTTTVVEIIRQVVRRGQRVLVCAPSNMGVDNVLDKLLAHGETAVRLGHPARVLPHLREHTLDLLLEDADDTRLARKMIKEAFTLFRQAGKWTRARPEAGAKQQMRQEARGLLADARRLESQAIASIIGRTPIVCATTTGLDDELLGNAHFDLVVIDEACQSTEPGCWIPLAWGGRLLLAGDPCQLPPTVVSAEAARRGFAISLHERLHSLLGPALTRRLDVQYRMHEQIMTFSSQEFYEGSLLAHDSVSQHRLCDLPGVTASPLTETPVTFIDSAGAGYDEELEPDGESRRNPQEADLATRKVRALLDAGVSPADIAVIAPYAAQVRLLRRLLASVNDLEIDSVDGFQGREKEAVVLSLVRSNLEGEIGFLADVRRTNVALTRARRKLIVLGDSATLAHHPFYQRLCEYFEAIQAYHTVWEE
ncbi:MAG: AAA domain-containing protein [Gemmataceae bacterium]